MIIGKTQRLTFALFPPLFLPAIAMLCEMLAKGMTSEPRMLQADFGFRSQFDPHRRLFAAELGGGALLDVGVYVVSLASMVFGQPDRTTGLTHLGETGVDEQSAFILSYPRGQLAVLSSAIRTSTPQTATIMGTEGMIHLPAPWWRPTQLHLTLPDQEVQLVDLPYEGNGYSYEAAEVMRCLRAGKLESTILPLDESRAIIQTLDRLRTTWGLTYPNETSHEQSQTS